MPPVASRTLQARPAYVRQLLLSNRIPFRRKSWKAWFAGEPTESSKSQPQENAPPSNPIPPTNPPDTKINDNHGDPIPRKEDILKTIDKSDISSIIAQGPRWFNDLLQTNRVQRPVFEEDPENEQLGGKKKRTGRSIDFQEKQLKRKIKHLEQQAGLDKDEWHFQRMTYAEMPPEARAGFLKVTGKTKEEVEGDEVLMPVSEVQMSTLKGLNKCLVKASQNRNDVANGKELWRFYCRCKWRIPNFLNHVTDRVWALLWETQDIDSARNPNRFNHLRVLTDDMKSVGKQISSEQETKRVEAVFKAGEEDDALWVWEDWYEQTLAKGELPTPDAMELGIRMHCRMNNLERVENLVQAYFKSYPSPDPRALIPVIDAFAKNRDDFAQRQALLYYLDLQRRLGRNITMKDYDSVSLSFFRARLPNLALIVFVDLMNSPTSPFRGPDLDQRAANRAQELLRLSNNVFSANATSLTALAVLPRRMQNKFFFGSWLKKLIGLGENEAAAQVIELMFERGIAPAPLHLNGLCTALFRSGKKPDRGRAESLIWAMVRQRIQLVEQRRKDRGEGWLHLELPHQVKLTEDGNIMPKFLERPIPAATTETFGVLALHYRRSGRSSLVPKLKDIMEKLDLPINALFLTQYLYAKMTIVKDYRNIWRTFRDVGVWYPLSASAYETMWKSVLFRIEKSKFTLGALAPQELFSHMAAWWKGVPDAQKDIESRDWDMKRYNLVLHIFLRMRDAPGAIAAMHAMRSMFGVYPGGDTVKEVVRGLAMLSFKAPTSGVQRMRITLSKSYDENVQATFVVLQALYEEMTGEDFVPRFENNRIPDNNYGDKEQLLNLLTQLIWVFAARTMDADSLRKTMWIAKNNMGIEDLKIGVIGEFTID